MANVSMINAQLSQGALDDASGEKENGLRDMKAQRRERAEMKDEIKEKQKRIKELQAEMEEIQADMDSAWGKVKGFFGSDGGLADTTEAIGTAAADMEKLNHELVLLQEETKDMQSQIQDKTENVNEVYQQTEEFREGMNQATKESL
jgi:chromosome segregation ATPase